MDQTEYNFLMSVYNVLLVGSKFFRTFGIFVIYDLLRLIPISLFLFLFKCGSAFLLIVIQKPFTAGRPLTRNQIVRLFSNEENAAVVVPVTSVEVDLTVSKWYRVGRHALFGSLITYLWLFGLMQCGPIRSVILFEHSDSVIVAGASAIFYSTGGAGKFRGAVFFLVAVVTLLLFDRDEKFAQVHDVDHIHETFMSHLFNHVIAFFGWSDHKGGVVLLLLTLLLHVGYNAASNSLSIEIGGAKRLHALSAVCSAGLLSSWAAFTYLGTKLEINFWPTVLIPLSIIVLSIGIVDYYVEKVAANHMQSSQRAFCSTASMLGGALLLGYTWSNPCVTTDSTLHRVSCVFTEDHDISAGVIFSMLVMLLATKLLLTNGHAFKGSFIGYSPSGVPLYNIYNAGVKQTSHSITSVLKNGLKQILNESDSRKIFFFLCINLAFTFVEFTYGAWSNSLGLISDGFHMLFDCSALVMGLYAAIMSRWKSTRVFSFGYDRVEVLSGFINGLFLVVIAVFVFTKAVSRLAEPPLVNTDRLLVVSVLGLVVNLVGICAFRSITYHGHSHGAPISHQHSISRCTSPTEHSPGVNRPHSHHCRGPDKASTASHVPTKHASGSHSHGNTNMEGVFLHVVADMLGSLGVIISSLLIERFGWNVADPLCSIFISALIIASVVPLLKETTMLLVLRTPNELESMLYLAFQKVSSIFKEIGIHSVTVQVEKDAFFNHMSGLGSAERILLTHRKSHFIMSGNVV